MMATGWKKQICLCKIDAWVCKCQGDMRKRGIKKRKQLGEGRMAWRTGRKNGRQGLTQPRASPKSTSGQNPVRTDLLIL